MLSLLLAVGLRAGACVPPPGIACGDGWCPAGYRCASIDLTPTCIESTCGDGVVGATEECDDGNLADNDDCLQACTLNVCGDGQINLRAEECDDGNNVDGDGCDSNCTLPACGNGVVAAGEMCDDGNLADNDGCDRDCTDSLLSYVKASTTGANDQFGYSVALSADGTTLVVGAWSEDSAATGVDGNQLNNSARDAGAVYVFTRSGRRWSLQAYLKASNTDANDQFGYSVALSADGSTLAVGAVLEDSAAIGIGGNQADDSAEDAGAVYVFTRSGTTWSQQAYLKASNTGRDDQFGASVALSADGSTLAVGAVLEDSDAVGIGGNQASNLEVSSGAVYVFIRSGTLWIQQAYVKPFNTEAGDQFGYSVALSADGSTLAVGAWAEDNGACCVGPAPAEGLTDAGAVYVFTRSGTSTWSQQVYIKSSRPGAGDSFGVSVALSADGSTLAVGAWLEDSAATGVGGDQSSNAAQSSGAVYVFTRTGVTWSQQAYVKASNTGVSDGLGNSVALSADGSTLAVGAKLEDSAATGIGGDQADNSAEGAGAVYMFRRSGVTWSQAAYLKASNTDALDRFGWSVALSGDGSVVAASSPLEASAAGGVGGDQLNNSAEGAGAVYVFLGPLGF